VTVLAITFSRIKCINKINTQIKCVKITRECGCLTRKRIDLVRER